MIITCKACSTSFNLDDKIIKPTGSKVRCSVCANVFTVFPDNTASMDTQEGQAEPDVTHGTTQTLNRQDNNSLHTPAAEPTKESDVGVSEIDDAVSKVLEESFDDLDLDLDIDDVDETDEADGATMIADLDDFDLDLPFDEPAGTPESDETILVDLDGEDLDLDIPVDADDDGEADDSVTMVISDLDEDDAEDEEGDLALALEEDQGSKDAVVEEEEELELELDFETEDDDSSVEASDSDQAGDQEDELLLDLDEGFAEEKEKSAASALEDDIDLSSLEEMFDDKEDDVATVVVGDDDLSGMALELDEESQDGGAAESKASDADGALPQQDAEDVDDSDGEIDLSEIEKMLEEPSPTSGQKLSAPEQDLNLNVEVSLESEKWMESGNDQLVADEELDLSELEQALEDVDSSPELETDDDQELDLDLSEDADLAKAAETVAIDKELDFDLSDFDDHSSEATGSGTSSRKPAEMELEFEVEESPEEQSYVAEEFDETVVMTGTGEEENTNAETTTEPVIDSPATSTPKKVKKKSKKSIVFLLVLLILIGAGYGVYYLSQNGVEIPFLSEYLNPKPKDTAGTLKLSTHDINSRFIDNSNLGKLFVITGKVRNGYDDNRGMVSIKGKILAANKQTLKQEKVYCGNIMSDLELANLEWDKIQARLVNRLGDNRSNVKIEPRKSIPFMVVFSGLPDDIEEFTIEVTGSTSLK